MFPVNSVTYVPGCTVASVESYLVTTRPVPATARIELLRPPALLPDVEKRPVRVHTRHRRQNRKIVYETFRRADSLRH